ncbi:hypothetical protein C5167_030500 [Papaver somniferum]|nr:hypothetical protein C5167_030500 [Papaver somniferum]
MGILSLSSSSLYRPQQPVSQLQRNQQLTVETSLQNTSKGGGIRGGGLKPIVVTGNPPTFVSAPGRRIIAVGDLHGDMSQTRSALEMAGVLSSDGRNTWIGGETVLVQLGDILDRGEDEIAILSLLRSLHIQAKANGGAVFQVNGNHETMNVEGDFRYVDQGGFEECVDFLHHLENYGDNWDEAFVDWVSVSEQWKQDCKMNESYWGPWNILQKQKGVIARSMLLRPGGLLSRELSRHPVALKVDDWVFCHGGLLPHHVAYGVEKMNDKVSRWMRGPDENGDNDPELPFIATRGYDSVIYSILQETLRALGGKAMVVGHTPQTEGINCIWRVDVGMSSGVLNSRPEVLEIIDNEARVIRSRTDMFSEFQEPWFRLEYLFS